MTWITKNGLKIKIKKIGKGITLSIIAMIILLWIPFIITQTSNFLKQTDPNLTLTDSEQLIEKASNAFKAGYCLYKCYESETLLEFTIWKNRTTIYLEAINIDPEFFLNKIEDSELSLDEKIVIQDQIATQTEIMHGENISSTFIIGADILFTTNAFTNYLSNEEFREELADNGDSIMEYGLSINSNIDDALFPKELKESWTSIYGAVFAGYAFQETFEEISTFQENIVDFFFK